MPLISTLKECLPEGSVLRGYGHPYLDERSTYGAEVALRLDDQSRGISQTIQSPDHVWTQLEAAKPEHAAIIIESIDDRWCDALCARFPHSINERFLLEHILAITLDLVEKYTVPLPPKQGSGRNSLITDIKRIRHALSGRNDVFQTDKYGFHVNYWYEPGCGSGPTKQVSRGDCVFQSRKSGWVKSNRFISCCRLDTSTCK